MFVDGGIAGDVVVVSGLESRANIKHPRGKTCASRDQSLVLFLFFFASFFFFCVCAVFLVASTSEAIATSGANVFSVEQRDDEKNDGFVVVALIGQRKERVAERQVFLLSYIPIRTKSHLPSGNDRRCLRRTPSGGRTRGLLFLSPPTISAPLSPESLSQGSCARTPRAWA